MAGRLARWHGGTVLASCAPPHDASVPATALKGQISKHAIMAER
jgi:hypothetical protein